MQSAAFHTVSEHAMACAKGMRCSAAAECSRAQPAGGGGGKGGRGGRRGAFRRTELVRHLRLTNRSLHITWDVGRARNDAFRDFRKTPRGRAARATTGELQNGAHAFMLKKKKKRVRFTLHSEGRGAGG